MDSSETNQKKKRVSVENVKWLFTYLKGYKKLYVFGMILTIVYNIMQLTVPVFSQYIVDDFLTGPQAAYNLEHNSKRLILLVAAMIGMTFLRTVVVYGTCMIFEIVSQGMLYRIRNKLFRKILNQDMSFYNQYRTGDLMTRLTGDLDAVRHMIAWVIRMVIECLSLFLASAVYFFMMDWVMALCILALCPFIFLITLAFRKEVAPMHRDLRERLSDLNTAAQENIDGNRVVKAFAREDYEIERFGKKNVEYSEARKKTALLWLKYFPSIEGLCNGLSVVLMLVGGLFLINGRLSMGEYVAFSGLLWTVANPMRNFGSIINEFQRFDAAATKVREIDETEPTIVSETEETGMLNGGSVEFRNVHFSYDGKEVLDGVNLTIQPGQTVAIMGETGGGKTSLIQLIPRFYDPTQGEVFVNGRNVRDWNLADLRRHIGLATQDVLLFSDTIDGNIAYGDSDMEDEQVHLFAELSEASEFIGTMPDGYNTIVGERGVGLSGGQKQRLALARAMAVRPEILILDDTTSAVDMETEHEIQNNLKNLDFPCTKLIIAQRISSTKDADRIVILEHGRITECGTHEELLKKHGYYYEVAKLQNGGEVYGQA